MLEELLAIDRIEVCAVITQKAPTFNSDFSDLEPLAGLRRIPIFYVTKNDQTELAECVNRFMPDVIFCFGWSYLLHESVLSLAPKGVIGYHPTLLPRNRGRHPIIWALALGLSETGSTFFRMDGGTDSGPIVAQERVRIDFSDNAETLYRRLTAIARKQLRKLVDELATNSVVLTPQDCSLATYWRKRSKADGKIDWRMPAIGICRLIRSLSRPYPGAYVEYHDSDIQVWRARPAIATMEDYEPGRIMRVFEQEITVQTGDGLVVLEDHKFDLVGNPSLREGGYL